MVQTARSGVQNIAEGSVASGTSKKMELKLTNAARAGFEELRLDCERFLRQRGLPLWAPDDPRRQELVARRCGTAGEVADWLREVRKRHGRDGPDGPNARSASSKATFPSMESIQSPQPRSPYEELAANAAHVLVGVAMAHRARRLSLTQPLPRAAVGGWPGSRTRGRGVSAAPTSPLGVKPRHTE